jgi:hypothetical protein
MSFVSAMARSKMTDCGAFPVTSAGYPVQHVSDGIDPHAPHGILSPKYGQQLAVKVGRIKKPPESGGSVDEVRNRNRMRCVIRRHSANKAHLQSLAFVQVK